MANRLIIHFQIICVMAKRQQESDSSCDFGSKKAAFQKTLLDVNEKCLDLMCRLDDLGQRFDDFCQHDVERVDGGDQSGGFS